jgi:hypothetical protein
MYCQFAFCMRSFKYILCLALISTGCVYKTGALRSQVRHYDGDGVINDASIEAPPFFLAPGFRIVFPAFDSRKPYEHSYVLKGVPKTKYGASTIYVRFLGNWSADVDKFKERVTSTLTFSILDEDGTILKSQDVVFKTAVWSWEGGGGDGVFGLWVHNRDRYDYNDFYFDPAKRYILRIIYVPGSVPPQTETIYVTVENGGRE